MKFVAVIIGIITIFAGVYAFTADKRPAHSAMDMNTPKYTFTNLKNQPAPDFTLPSYDNQKYTLSKFRGKKVVLFFNEGIMCYPACWNQIAALGKDPRFNNNDVVTFSIVPDERNEWVEAVHKMPDLGKTTILLDVGTAVSAKYDTLNLESSMHRGSKPGHTYVLVDAKGIVRYTQDDMKMGVHNDELAQELEKI